MSASKRNTAGVALQLDMARQLAPGLSAFGHGISEYCFSNLYLFRHIHQYALLDGDYPCIAGTTYDGKSYLMPLFDVTAVSHEVLLTLIGEHDFFFPISEKILSRLDASRFEFSHCRDDSDYLYSAENFIHYSGKKLRKKKNLMNQHLRGGEAVAVPFGPEHRDDARLVLDTWQEDKQKAAKETDYHATLEALTNLEALGLIGFMHYRDQRPSGFLLGKQVWPGIFAVHFAKGISQDNGIFQYMFHHLATQMEGRFPLYNFEQDLGIANFRKTKQSYCPCQRMMKYRVKPINLLPAAQLNP